MLTFLHAADFHLTPPFMPSPEQAAERRQGQRQLLTRLADTARQAQVISWSFWRGPFGASRPGQTVQALYRVLEELEAEVFLSPATTTPTPHLPLRKVSLAGPRTYLHPGRPGPGGGAQLRGGGLRQCLYLPLPDGQPPGQLPRPGGGPGRFRLLSWGPLSPTAATRPITHNEIAASGLHYLALGHSASGLEAGGKKPITPGPAARRGGALT